MSKSNIILITDIGKDPDDTIALHLLCKLHKADKINLLGIIVNCGDYKTLVKRAKLVRNILSQFDLELPICFDSNANVSNALSYDQNTYNAPHIAFKNAHKKYKYISKDIFQFLDTTLSLCGDQSVTLDICSTFNDIAKYLGYNPKLFLSKIKDLYIMGNAIYKDDHISLDTKSYNIKLNIHSANNVVDFVKKYDINTYFLPSYAIKQKSVDTKYIRQLCVIDPIFKNLYNQQKQSYKRHYLHAKNNQDIEKDKYTLSRFIKNFTDLNIVRRYQFCTIWKHVTNIYLYDPYTVLLSIPKFQKALFDITSYGPIHICQCKTDSHPNHVILDVLNDNLDK